MSDAGLLMDRIYSAQRHIYDITRKFYLLGRDDLIAELGPPVGGTVLEIGCGTARNLIAVARRYPQARCFGLDVSKAMLETAQKSVDRCKLGDRIRLVEADATVFDPGALFGVGAFDRVMISYALSMIPPWQAVLERASLVLAPAGSLHIVDFGDQARLPRPFKSMLETWLSWFHVTPRVALAREIERVAQARGLATNGRPCFRGYAFRAEIFPIGSANNL